MPAPLPLHLAVALEGAGWHPSAWRDPRARADELLSPAYWTDLVREAETGTLDLVTVEDSLGIQTTSPDGPDDRVDQVRGRLDAVLIAARVAPVTRGVGVVPVATVTHTEPFHVSKAIATLDYVSRGRAGWQVRVSPREWEAELFGRRTVPAIGSDLDAPESVAAMEELFDEAADYVEVVRRLWDSWEDDAEIRDVATGRFVDREKLHYIDFEGRWFSVRGPSIVPRPPQGQPLVTALAHRSVPYRFAAKAADVVFVTAHDAEEAGRIVAEVRHEQAAAGRQDEPLHVFGDLVVFLADDERAAAERKAHLDALSGTDFTSDAPVFVGTPGGLADRLEDLRGAGLTGFRLRPGTIPHDLEAVTRGLVPELRRRGIFRERYDAPTLRGRLGLERPANRYAATTGGAR
ncbi:Flavin-dependent oxidoreductase, luciferase family (includes alkanesulfonate monooxygenase SsuD and methylene tetrahydromethanopterin reductase) [Actinopolymorpha cephalotaxi]|uniref:Alkanesulfonate monooxygenase SsuD/methylene tetrahydromethanopterin reductase-like flavin-dependent oxidoreductase (Luciferase family) n=1 Tax=Actinopolymorpha cephalotaxi TaxID=504797 RepID=A0A1I2PL28_9ACTN|nr:LLM class flavin-dependent oxidoreductase [Actinopolymorpha cephalotaxi]NYH83653.1 alkanesulfonate monooxygenase SsuD/methylene tetrahydromethanopterin reductase-like flavin-dependent oxidoreductase (luciferase family) [Actinopolymorpha cephalotaxi]SFG14111.1 Flavin-dependent oxidoreductase, luciferase family (includes alkanesulfonate monooxygenase SsuD and methylene tetrahydromethanopterin reductase) [Actinopolymorpha cephalotaxi]